MSNSTTIPDFTGGPRSFITTPDDHGGIALVVCTLMATFDVLCWLVRMYMRATVSGPFGVDDVVCTIATIFGVAQCIVSCVAIGFGFGKSTSLLSASNIINAEKTLYAAQLLYIVTNALAKATVALLLARIVFVRSRKNACYAVLVIAALWGLGAFLALAIRCSEYPPWQIVGGQCPNTVTEWQTITGLNVTIEVLLFALPIWLVWDLQTGLRRKVTVVSVFALRLPVIAAAIARIHFLTYASNTDQVLLTGVNSFICLNIEMHYAVLSATFPTLKPFVAAFNTSWGTYDSQGVSGYGSQGSSYAMNSLNAGGHPSRRQGSLQMLTSRASKRNASLSAATRSADRESRHSDLRGIGVAAYGKNVTHIRSTADEKAGAPDAAAAARRPSHASDDSQQQMIIHQTMTCEVHYEEDSIEGKSE